MSGFQGQASQPQRAAHVKVLRCDTCGTITHKVERSLFGKKKIPLTIEGKSLRGICLICNGPSAPVPTATAAAPLQATPIQATPLQAIPVPLHATAVPANALPPITIPQQLSVCSGGSHYGVPQELVVNIRGSDDATVVSAITLDHRFDAPDESDEESSNFRVTPGQRRPEPSLGDPDEYERPAPLRRRKGRPSVSKATLQPPARPEFSSSNHNNNHFGTSSPMSPHSNTNNSSSNTGNNIHNQSPWMASPMSTSNNNNHHSSSGLVPMNSYELQERQFFSSAQVPQIFENQIYEQQGIMAHSPIPPSFGNHHLYSTSMPPSIGGSSYGQEEKAEIEPTIPSEWNTGGSHSYGGKETLTGRATYSHTLSDIPDLINRLQTNSGDHTNVIQSLAESVWEYGQQAKITIMRLSGLEGVTRSMWENMADADVQEAALNLIFALASSNDGLASSDIFIGKDAEDAVDALLIVMQTHLTVENIQHTGCGTLACLAAASGSNPSVDDASLSGALLTVVSSMEAHRNSKGVQEWGIRALYNQCVYSRSAESNKRCLAKAGMEDNKCGATVIYRAIEISEADMVTMEWACRLYWCLSASEDVAEFLTVTNHPLYVILEALQRYHQLKEAAGLLIAIFGALANLVKVRENYKVVDSSVLFIVVKSAQIQRTNEDLLVEACALIANLVYLSEDNAEAAINADAVNVIFNALLSFPKNAALFEEGVRSLACLCLVSQETKMYLCTPTRLACLTEACSRHIDSAYGQEMFIQLIGSLLTQKGLQHTVVAKGGVDVILSAMETYPNDRRVQEAGCLAMRNLACHHDDLNIAFGEPIRLILKAMASHEGSEKVQLNGCCTLWNLATVEKQLSASDTETIDPIVKAMQRHMESPAVLEMACGALCAKITGSQAGKQLVVDSGGLDAVTCVLVMHPNEPAAIEKAFAVLSCMSASTTFADEVANVQCMSNVVEAMRANSSRISLLEFGALVLRNIILVRPEHVEEANGVVATVLKGMREHPDAVSFQREACCLLWSMAAMSEKCKDKVLSLDGITVLLGCLEHNSSFSDVQDAALGAFNQLTPGIAGMGI